MSKTYLKIIVLFLALILNSTVETICSQDSYDEILEREHLNFDDTNLSNDFDNDETKNIKVPASENSNLQELAFFLSDYVKQPLWSNTRPPAVRDVLYLMPYKPTSEKNKSFSVNIFYNETPHMKVSVGSIIQDGAINDKDAILDLAGLYDTQARASVIPLFKKVSLQERRIGALLQSDFKRGPLTANINTSLLLDERNCWLSKNPRTKLLDILGYKEKDIPIEEFYKLKVGIGDTKLGLDIKIIDKSNTSLNVGIQTTIPTSRLSYKPKYNVNIDSVGNTSDIDEFTESMLAITRNIRNYLLNPRFGNGGHFGFGFYTEAQTKILKDQAQIWTRLSFDTLFAAHEDRLFFFKQTQVPENLNPGQDAFNYLKQYVLPTSFTSQVHPGCIFNFTLAANTDVGKTKWTGGYNFYAQEKERIKKIINSQVNLSDLKVSATEALQVLQHKIFVEAMYRNRLPFGLGVGLDGTILSSGIGKDWTLYIKFSGSF